MNKNAQSSARHRPRYLRPLQPVPPGTRIALGIAMGAWKAVEAFFEPFVSFARYLPASAFIPLLILWAGIGETQKLLVIFIGSVFQIILMVAVTVGQTRRDLVEAAYTLGARCRRRARRLPRRCASCSAGPGHTSSSRS